MSIALLTASNNASSATQEAATDKTYNLIASGAFGGGSLTAEYSADGSVWVPSEATALTAIGTMVITPQPGQRWRVTLAGATAGSVTVTAF